jgi:hypothetical protein
LSRKEREQAAGSGWTAEEWRSHLDLHGNKCLSCGSGEYLVPDHVVPLYRGGPHDLGNIQPLCKKCNFAKGLKIVDYRGIKPVSSCGLEEQGVAGNRDNSKNSGEGEMKVSELITELRKLDQEIEVYGESETCRWPIQVDEIVPEGGILILGYKH